MKSFNVSDLTDLGIPEIDRQHRQILHFIKAMGEALGTNNEESVLRSTIRQMIEYSVRHFSFESGLMKKDKYEGLKDHLELHGIYNAKVKEFSNRYSKTRDLKAAELVTWLWEWWMEHIQVHDRIWATEHVAKGIQS